MRKTISFPFEIPPFMPPQLFVAVRPSAETMQSLYSEPSIDAEAIPLPNSMAFAPGIENIA